MSKWWNLGLPISLRRVLKSTRVWRGGAGIKNTKFDGCTGSYVSVILHP